MQLSALASDIGPHDAQLEFERTGQSSQKRQEKPRLVSVEGRTPLGAAIQTSCVLFKREQTLLLQLLASHSVSSSLVERQWVTRTEALQQKSSAVRVNKLLRHCLTSDISIEKCTELFEAEIATNRKQKPRLPLPACSSSSFIPYSIEDRRSAFLEKSTFVEFPISEPLFNVMKEKFDTLNRHALNRQNWTKEKISTYIKTCDRQSPEINTDFLSLGCLVYERLFGIRPYSTQIITVLLLLQIPEQKKGNLAQVHTGEGKTLIVTLAALILALKGRKVDIISSSPYLSQRDQKKHQAFFEQFGLSSSHISEHLPPDKRFEANIVYGTNYDFEFSLLRAWMPEDRSQKGCSILKRGADCAIVDEVDNLFVDTALSSARISHPAPLSHLWIWPALLDFVGTHQAEIAVWRTLKKLFQDESQICSDRILDALFTKLPSLRESLDFFSKELILEWLGSAYTALYTFKEGIDYVVETEEDDDGSNKQRIVIVDKQNTGRKQEHSRWSYGLHQLLECKHGIPPEEEDIMPASISHPVYFSRYTNLFGLSGTIGKECEREEIEELYKVCCVDIPMHTPHNGHELPTLLLDTQEEHHKHVLDQCRLMQREGRPCLVLFSTITASNQFAMSLRQADIPFQTLNDTQKEKEELVIQRAGEESMITIATNTAGRGTDIILKKAVLEKGGLHVIVTFFPENDRVQAQAFGRAARQGQNGSYQMILLKQEALSSVHALSAAPQKELLSFLLEARQEKIKTLSSWRKNHAAIENLRLPLLTSFLKSFAAFQQALDEGYLQHVSQHLARIALPSFKAAPTEALLQQTTAKAWFMRLESVKTQFTYSLLFDWSFHVYEKIDLLAQSSEGQCLQEFQTKVDQIHHTFLTRKKKVLEDPKKQLQEKIQTLYVPLLSSQPTLPFSELQQRALQEAQTIYRNLLQILSSKTYWPIDPRQWYLNTANSFIREHEEEERSGISSAQNLAELLQKLHNIRNTRIPYYLSWLALCPILFPPLPLLQTSLQESLSRLDPLIRLIAAKKAQIELEKSFQ